MLEARMVIIALYCFAFLRFGFVAAQTAGDDNQCDQLLDFEEMNQLNCFSAVGGGSRSLSVDKAKSGQRSLKWEVGATAGSSVLTYTRPSSSIITGNKLRRGGVKLWLYKKDTSNGRILTVHLRDGTRRTSFGGFDVNLGFKGWRAVWVAYSECKSSSIPTLSPFKLSKVTFSVSHKDTIYFDLIDFVDHMSFQTRDKIVPPINQPGYDKTEINTARQLYRWSQKQPTNLPIAVDSSKTEGLNHIESRLRNFYCSEGKTSYDFTGFLMKRWKSLTKSIDKAHEQYDKLIFKTASDGAKVISGPSLFCYGCKKGTTKYSATDQTRKFSFVMANIMLPLAQEYYLRSRQGEIDKTVEKELKKLSSSASTKVRISLKRIAGNHKPRQDEFLNYLNSKGKPYTKAKVRESLEYMNKVRLQRVINLLDYVADQGWTDGSAIGSIRGDLNQNGPGYMHTLFLLKNSLHENSANKSRLLNLVSAAKWYNYFGEVYQRPYEYKGTNADRMITTMLFRLLTVLIMPTDTPDEQRARQRDMDALKLWMDNALAINKAFGGVIKPDFTGFHHMVFYASAYIPQALHTAAQLQYLLEGTDYALSHSSKKNLLETLKTLRVTAVKYSTPNSVGGRFPSFSRKILVNMLPAYAYVSVTRQCSRTQNPLPRVHIPDLNTDAEIFLRLYQPSDQTISKYLGSGRISQGKSYMNTMGSLDIMIQAHKKAVDKGMAAESSPNGHWSKNFAALSIHRREDWAVTVKGFNKFVWDFEMGPTENPNGIFQSYGQMLIANSEESLLAHDVEEGWDWTRIPGATTISLTLEETRVKKARYFSPRSFAGGVTFKGPEPLSNGVFGMDYYQPDYQFIQSSHPQLKLSFKKSVFFFQNIVVCLGSNIEIKNGQGKIAQTTLFQDKVRRVETGNQMKSFSIELDGIRKDGSTTFVAMVPPLDSTKRYISLLDTKGNSYYIPPSSASSLKVQIANQNSRTPAARPSSGRYATAWLEHSSSDDNYEYAVYVKTTSYPKSAKFVWDFQASQLNNKVYKVLQKNEVAHVVKFEMSLVQWRKVSPAQFGYVIFSSTRTLPSDGPIRSSNQPCLIMAREDGGFLYLSVSYPDLAFPNSDHLRTMEDIGVREYYHVESQDISVTVVLRKRVHKSLPEQPVVHGSPPEYLPTVQVKSTNPTRRKGNKIVFTNLKNGFSVEVKLRI
ncbi:uncharacterized protein LOC111339361 [Stylophora pistillata]|nr:uncharacterized protein LOC111339361 [Stylophora pistillata]XP_022801744.1 uncharacterized protein LOC111339361 [Stylophora pistillata]